MSETTVVSADGAELAARSSGSGPPLVLVHGAMSNIDGFAMIEPALAEHHTVWVFSRRGRGGSGDGPSYSIDREADDVLAVLQAAGEDAHLFGHSSGAIYALLAARQGPSLRSLTVYEPPLYVDRIDPAMLQGLLAALEDDDPDRALEIFMPAVGIPQQEIEAIRSLEPVWEALREGVRVFPREAEAISEEGRGRILQRDLPDVPMRYLYGELQDTMPYPTLDEVAELFPRAEVVGLPGQRHMAPAFDPAGFTQALLACTTGRAA